MIRRQTYSLMHTHKVKLCWSIPSSSLKRNLSHAYLSNTETQWGKYVIPSSSVGDTWNMWLTDTDRPITCSLLVLQHKEHLRREHLGLCYMCITFNGFILQRSIEGTYKMPALVTHSCNWRRYVVPLATFHTADSSWEQRTNGIPSCTHLLVLPCNKGVMVRSNSWNHCKIIKIYILAREPKGKRQPGTSRHR